TPTSLQAAITIGLDPNASVGSEILATIALRDPTNQAFVVVFDVTMQGPGSQHVELRDLQSAGGGFVFSVDSQPTPTTATINLRRGAIDYEVAGAIVNDVTMLPSP